MTSEILTELYRKMFLIRVTEESLLGLFAKGQLSGTTHTYIGQEANAVGVISHLKQSDVGVPTTAAMATS